MKLLTLNKTAKIGKGLEYGWNTAILHLAPSAKTCPFASKGCMASCLTHAGRGGFNAIQEARQRKTELFFNDPLTFHKMLVKELNLLSKRAERKGEKWAVRLNGTSDCIDTATYADAFPNLTFYDYTKDFNRFYRESNSHHLTFSFSGDNLPECKRVLALGGNVAVCFNVKKGEPLPSHWEGFPVIDGDTHDLRFLDPKNVVVGLRFKLPKDKHRKKRSEIAVSSGFSV